MKRTLFLIGMIISLSVAQAQVNEDQRLISDDIAEEDYFGNALAVSGDYAIIGVCNDDDNAGEAGSAYIFYNNAGTWEQQIKLTASDAQEYDFFGISVAISGNYAFVNSIGANNYTGKVYVFHNEAGTWVETAILTASDGAEWDFFGYSIDVDGDYAVIGAYGDDDNGESSGSAYIFYNNTGTWEQQIKHTASDATAGDDFGYSVSISGNNVLIGAPSKNSVDVYSGASYIFHNDSGAWSETQQLLSDDASAYDYFGNSVSISGNYAVVGAYSDCPNGLIGAGSAYVFNNNFDVWEQQTKLIASNPEAHAWFGSSVSISGNQLVIGAKGEIFYTPYVAGSAYLFTNTLESWQETAILQASDIASQDQFGYVVDYSDEFVFVGSPRSDTNYVDAGAVYVYHFPYVNNPPVANAGENQIVDEVTIVQLDGSNSFDPDVDELTFIWSSSPEIELSNPNIIDPTFVAPDVEEDTTYMLTLVVCDGLLNSDPDEVEITVLWDGVDADDNTILNNTTLISNYPNPFNPSTTIVKSKLVCKFP